LILAPPHDSPTIEKLFFFLISSQLRYLYQVVNIKQIGPFYRLLSYNEASDDCSGADFIRCRSGHVEHLVFKNDHPQIRVDRETGELCYLAEDLVMPFFAERDAYRLVDIAAFPKVAPYVDGLMWHGWGDAALSCVIERAIPEHLWALFSAIPIWGSRFGFVSSRHATTGSTELPGCEPEQCPGIEIRHRHDVRFVIPGGAMSVSGFYVVEPEKAAAIFPELIHVNPGTRISCGAIVHDRAYLRLADLPPSQWARTTRDSLTLYFVGTTPYVDKAQSGLFPDGGRVLFRGKEYFFSDNPPAEYWHRCEVARPSLVGAGGWRTLYQPRLGVLAGKYALKSLTPDAALRQPLSAEQSLKRNRGFLAKHFSDRVAKWTRDELEAAFIPDGKRWFSVGDVQGWPRDAAPKKLVDLVFRRAKLLRYCPIQMKDMVHPITFHDIAAIPGGAASMLSYYSGDSGVALKAVLTDSTLRDTLLSNLLMS